MTASNAAYRGFVKTIKTMVSQAQYEALKKVNKELGWGKSVAEQLAKDLQAELPGVKGFSAANLWRMGHFYNEYKDNLKLAPLVREISWTKNVIILA